jgi:hypothetical protein
MKNKKRKTQKELKHISLFASSEEWSMFEAIKKHYFRKTDSDTLRFLIKQEAEKILSPSTPNGVN